MKPVFAFVTVVVAACIITWSAYVIGRTHGYETGVADGRRTAMFYERMIGDAFRLGQLTDVHATWPVTLRARKTSEGRSYVIEESSDDGRTWHQRASFVWPWIED